MYRTYMNFLVVVILASFVYIAGFAILTVRENHACARRGGTMLEDHSVAPTYVKVGITLIPVYNTYCSVDQSGNPVPVRK